MVKVEEFIPSTTRKHKQNVIRFKIFRISMIATTILITMSITLLSVKNPEQPNTIPHKNGSNPIIVWANFIPWIHTQRSIQCFNKKCDVIPACFTFAVGDAYLFYGYTFSGLGNFPLPRGEKTIWGLFYEETPTHMTHFLYERALNAFNFSAIYGRFSDVPFPLMWLESLRQVTSLDYYVNTSRKNDFIRQYAPVAFVQSDCTTATERTEYVQELMKFIPVDCLGNCLFNKFVPATVPYRSVLECAFSEEFFKFIAEYKFIIAMEDNVCDDYITEKLWRSIKLGVVPIYFGSPLIRDWLPNKMSAILVEDFPTPELLSAHLYELLQNDTKYEEYLEHKTKGLVTNKRLYKEIKARPYQRDILQAVNKLQCLVCERIHDKNSTQVNIVTKKHFNCPIPTSALTLSVNPYNSIVKRITEVKTSVDELFSTYFLDPNQFDLNTHALCPDYGKNNS